MRVFSTIVLCLVVCSTLFAADRQSLSGHVPAVVRNLQLQPVGSLAATQRLHLAIGLPLRNRAALTNLLQEIYNPANPQYHHYLKPDKFVERFGPSEADYAAVEAFASTNGWTISGHDPGRMLVDVSATVADIERVCHVKMWVYQHPSEARTFFAPDREPSLDLPTPVQDISGLNNYVLPHPCNLVQQFRPAEQPAAGSGPGGTLMGNDFRAAYAPSVTLDGAGQTLGLMEFDGFYASDISDYESQAGLPDVPITIESVGGFDENPTTNANDVGEVSLDIEMAISMAPGLSKVIVYEAASDQGLSVEILGQMANDGTAAQISSSWNFNENATKDDYLQRLAAQGQSFFQASGDDNAYSNGVNPEGRAGPPADDPYLTSVGGTILTLGPKGGWQSETVWNNSYTGKGTNGSGGGISTNYPIPIWQRGTSMTANGGSTTMRNIPDVAMAAASVWAEFNNAQTGSFWGTSCSAPLWAGFIALANQQAAILGAPPVGFINPSIYRLGNGPGYAASFHDIITGNNANPATHKVFYAVPGYDLCTGWGTPNGQNLINALTMADPLSIYPANGFTATGGVGGPFAPNQQTFYLTNPGPGPVNWAATSDSTLLDVSPVSGFLPAAGSATVTVTLGPSATNLSRGWYLGNIVFSNLNLGTGQLRPFSVQSGQPLLTFDDLPDSDKAVPSGYGGVNWSNLFYLNPVNVPYPNGYEVAMVSSPNVAYNGGGNPASIVSGAPFDLVSGVLAAAWRNNLKVEIQGYSGSSRTYDRTLTLNTASPTEVLFNYDGVTSVTFNSSGGTLPGGFQSGGYQFAMDNLVVVPHNSPPPPTLVIVSPTAGQSVAGLTEVLAGTASDIWRLGGVFYSLNGGNWTVAATTNQWTNWFTLVTLVPGTNTLAAYAVDAYGNASPTANASFFLAVSNQLQIRTLGLATLSPNDSNAWLAIGRDYSINATPAPGFSFADWTISTNWLGGVVTNQPTVQFMMASNLTLTATLVDTQKPVLTITAPAPGQRVGYPLLTVNGTASDNWQVAGVWLQLNDGNWSLAGGTTNWSAAVNLSPGTNRVQAYAVDNSGNHSLTNLVTLDYVVTNQLGVRFLGLGTLSPNDSNVWLEVGRNYSLTAAPATDFVFTNWTVSTNWQGGVMTNQPTVEFIMASNLTLTAVFRETTRPVVTITNLTAGQKLTNLVLAVKGTASDNWQVMQVWCRFNSNAWLLAATTNLYANWSATNLALTFGTNLIRVYAENFGGQFSITNSLAVVATNALLIPPPVPPGLVIAGVQMTAGGIAFKLQITGAATGFIQVSTNLTSWASVTNFAGTNLPVTFTDRAATNASRRFYRAVAQ